MRDLGFNQPLYVLPFDHRESFQTKMFGLHSPLSIEQTAQIAAAKRIIYDGFRAAIKAGVPKDRGALLVDEQFGDGILRDAKKDGFNIACPAEKSGQDEFDFEFGPRFREHIEKYQPTFSKVLVRYNPAGDRELNRRQAERLKELSDYLHRQSSSRLMFELLMPSTKPQLEEVGGDKKRYDLEIRPKLMERAILELQDAGIEPDVWKIEGLDRREDCEMIVSAAIRNGRDRVGCIVLGRAEDEKQVSLWLTTAAGVPGFIGFAIGRTVFWDPLVDYRSGKITREAAVTEIARRYARFVRVFEDAHSSHLAHLQESLRINP